jgi:hypothetical protein
MFCEWAKDHKQALVNQEGIGNDLIGCILVKKNTTWMACYAPLVADLVRATVSAQILEPESVTLIAEVYHLKGQALFSIPLEELHPRFANGDPHVVESIAVMTTARDELMLSTALNYRYLGKQVDWLEPELRVGSMESEVECHMHMAGSAPVPPEVMSAIQVLGDLPSKMKFLAWNFIQNFPCQVAIMTDEPPPGFLAQGVSLN